MAAPSAVPAAPPPATMIDPPPPLPTAAVDAPPPTPPRPRRRLRLVLGVAGGVVALLAATVALLPAMASTDIVRRRVEAAVTDAAERTFSLAAIDASWSRTVLRGVRLGAGRGADAGDLVTVEEILAEPEILPALRGSYRVPLLRISGPVVRVDLRDRASPAAGHPPKSTGPRGAGAGGEAAATVPDFRVRVEIAGGRLVVVLPDGTETAPLRFSGTVDASRDGRATADVAVEFPGGGRAALRAAATPFAGGKPAAPDAMEPEATIDVAGLALEGLLPLLRPFVDVRTLTGTLSLAARARPDGDGILIENLRLEGGRLGMTGPVIGEGRVLDEPSLLVEAAALRLGRAGPSEARDAHLAVHGLDVRASVGRVADGWQGTVAAKGALSTIVGRARAWGVAAEGAMSGEFTLDATCAADAATQRATGSLTVKEFQVSPGPGRPAYAEPSVRAVFDVLAKDGALRIDGTTLEAAFLSARCGGTLRADGDADLRVSGAARLGPLVATLRALGFAPPGEFAGDATFDVDARRSAGTAEARGTVVFEGLAVRPPGEGSEPVRQDRVEIRFDAAPAGNALDVRTVEVRAGFARVAARGTASADGTEGTLETEVDVDAAPAAAILEALGLRPGAAVAGRATWRGPVSWTGRGDGLRAKGRLAVDGARVTLPAAEGAAAREIREPRLEIEIEAARAGDTVSADRVRLVADGVDVSLSGTLDGARRVDAHAVGSLDLAAAARRAAALGLLEKDPGAVGTLRFDLGASGPASGPRVVARSLATEGAVAALSGSGTFDPAGAVDARVRVAGEATEILALLERAGLAPPGTAIAGGVEVEVEASAADGHAPVRFRGRVAGRGIRRTPPGGAPAEPADVDATTEGTWDRANSTVIAGVAVNTAAGTVQASGSATLRPGAASFDARGTLDVDAGALAVLAPETRVDGVRPGRISGTFAARGPLRAPFDLEPLTGEARLAADRVATDHVTFTALEVDALLQGGALATRSLTAKANGGDVSGRVVFAAAGATRRHVADLDATGVALDAPLAALLARVIPFLPLEGMGEATGRVDTTCRLEAEGADARAIEDSLRGTGTLAIRDGGVRGAGMAAAVLEFLGSGREYRFASVTTDFSVRDRRVWNDRLTVNGIEQDMVLRGSTSFSGEIDYRIGASVLRLSPRHRERFAPLLDADGFLPFAVSGTLRSPKVRVPDLKDAAAGALEGLVRKGLEGLLDGGGKDDGAKKPSAGDGTKDDSPEQPKAAGGARPKAEPPPKGGGAQGAKPAGDGKGAGSKKKQKKAKKGADPAPGDDPPPADGGDGEGDDDGDGGEEGGDADAAAGDGGDGAAAGPERRPDPPADGAG